MDEPCGDCGAITVAAIHKGQIVEFNLSIDDREGHQPGLECRMIRVATSARWPDSER